MVKRYLPLLAALLLSAQVSGQSVSAVSASYQDGLVSISCRNAALESVFEKLEEVAGLELILEDAVKNKRLTANLENVPIAMALQRLLEGTGVNYAVMMDPRDWGRVDKVFVGAGGGGPARSAPPPRRRPVNPALDQVDDDGYDDFSDDAMMDEDFDDMNDDLVDDPNDENMPSDFAPPGSSPVPGYLPPQQSFPRSNFTPGLPGPVAPGANQPQPNQTAPPPATMPFMDALGRPIPVPPDMNQQEQRRRQQQQQQ
ncbi:MAG: hypothetical protein BMS9Abin37_1070 [Acidobacteriota bacterium]|nr:MAG: hypothetical protein BMS9Abin37_1070 [Acidobacteriota bacterium]